MDLLKDLLNIHPAKSRKDAAKKPRRARSTKRRTIAAQRDPRREMTAAEVVREALLRG